MKILFNQKTIQTRVAQLSQQIENSLSLRTESVTCCPVLNGAMFFAVDLIRNMKNSNLYLHPIRAKSYANNERGKLDIENTNHIQGNDNILIIEDICDSGTTLQYLYDSLIQNNKNVYTVSLLLRNNSPYEPDYSGFNLLDSSFVFGYGLDYHGLYRNLPDIMVA